MTNTTKTNRITKTLCFAILLLPSPVTGQGLEMHFKNEYKSEYMVFHYNDDVSRAKDLAEFCDGFIDVINTEFFKANFKYPIHAYVLKDRDSYKSFMKKMEMFAQTQTAGIFLTGMDSFVTYEDAGYGTFAHEIMHPLVRVNLGSAPPWTVEGLPGFFEMFFGYWSRNKLVLRFGFHNRWRIWQMKEKILSLDIESIVKAQGDHGTSEMWMVSQFLHKHGKLKEYIKLVGSHIKIGYSTFIEAMFKKRLFRIIPEWETYLYEVYNSRDQIYRIPQSDIFDSKEQYESFMKANGLQ
jgi:hypothetical protein